MNIDKNDWNAIVIQLFEFHSPFGVVCFVGLSTAKVYRGEKRSTRRYIELVMAQSITIEFRKE